MEFGPDATIAAYDDDNVSFVELRGRFASDAAAQLVMAACADAKPLLVVDLSTCRHLGARAIQLLLHARLSRRYEEMVIVATPHAPTWTALAEAGVLQACHITRDVPAARRMLRAGDGR